MAKEYARYLRNNLTDAEQFIWQYLRKRQVSGYKFRRHTLLTSYALRKNLL